MKKLILITLIYSLAAISVANEKKDGETRSAIVTVDISPSDKIIIEAKHTELTVETWDKDEVEIEANIRFDGKMTDRMQEFLDEFEANVKNNIRKSANELSIKTNLDLPNKVQIGSRNVGIIVSYGDNELKLSYKIKAPGSNRYVINNSYEDVVLYGVFDDVDFTQYSGELEAKEIKKAQMNLKYGSATIQQMGEVDMQIYEQELDVERIESLTINTKYSDIELNTTDKVSIEAYESDLQFTSIGELKGELKYGEITIDEKLATGELTLYEVDIEAGEIKDLNLKNSKYSKFDIERMGNLTFDQSYEDETKIRTLANFKSLNSKYGNHSIDILTGSFDLNAYEDEVSIGSVGKKASKIYIDGKYIDSSLGLEDIPFSLLANVKYGKVDYDESAVDVRKYIKDGDQLEVEIHSKNKSDNSLQISVKGYEVDVDLD